MYVKLRFVVSIAALFILAICPNEWEIIVTRLGASILLLLYEAEEITKVIKDMRKGMEVK